MLEMIIEFIKQRKVKIVCASGHGETTIYRDWHLYCNQLIENGMRLHIISNFAKTFSIDELETLSHFDTIEISCDTSNPDLFGKLRRGARLERLISNLENLHKITVKNDRKLPTVSFSCVVSDKNVFGLKNYVNFGLDYGVKHFNFCNLLSYPPLRDEIRPAHVTEMSLEKMKNACLILKETFAFLERSGIEYHLQQSLMDSLEEKIHLLDSTGRAYRNDPPECDSSEKTKDFKDPLKTRDCLDPWSFFLVESSGNVKPCCWHASVGSVSKGQSLNTILNNQQIQTLRKGLLTGNLSPYCQRCPSRGWTSIENLKKKVAQYLIPDVLSRFFFSKQSSLKTAPKKPYEIVFQSGWYPVEENSDTQEPEWKTWRWMARRAICFVKNPFKPSTFIIRGRIHKKNFPDQKVSIKIGDRTLDEFVPPDEAFYKEYHISTQMLGRDAQVILNIQTNRFFIPAECEPGSRDSRELAVQIHEIYFGKRI
jgi:MoaA/NifB/PqqE/SkfB family radical SAM enzyme